MRVNAVAPGWIASSGFDTYPADVQAMLRTLRNHTPLQRFGTEAEVSAAIVFLLSPAAGFISGDTLRVDGAAPNAKRHVDLEPHDRSRPWNGFHRSVLPKLLQEE